MLKWKHGLMAAAILLAVCALPGSAWALLPAEGINLQNPGFESTVDLPGWWKESYYDPSEVPPMDYGYGNMYFTLSNDSHSGSHSLLLYSDLFHEFGPVPYMEAIQPLDVRKGDNVTVTFWTKGHGRYAYITSMGTPWPPYPDDMTYLTADSDDWVKQTVSYTQPHDSSDIPGYIYPCVGIWYSGGGNASVLFDDFTVTVRRNTVVPNPGFESGTNGFLHWTPFASRTTATIETVSGGYPLLANQYYYASGTHGLHLAKANYVQGSGAYFGVASDMFAARPGNAVVSYLANGTRQGPLYVKVDLYRNGSTTSWVTSKVVGVPGTAGWQRNSFSLAIPQGVTKARIVFVSYNNCDVMADDFELNYT